MQWSDALPSFLIGLREGLEAGLVVTILLAAVGKAAGSEGSARRRSLPVWVGAFAAVAASASFAAVLTFSTSLLDARGQQILGGSLSVLAVVLVTAMIFWMRGAARTLSSQLREKVESALAIGAGAVALTAFASVAREGLETTLFLWTSAKATGESAGPLIGAVLGLAAAFVLCALLYRRAIRLNLGVFFRRTAALLVVVAAGVLAYGIGDLQATGLIPGWTWQAFDFEEIAPADSWWVTLITGVTQLTPRMTVLQATAWAVYLVGVLVAFYSEGKDAEPEAAARGPEAAEPARPSWFERALQRRPWQLVAAAILAPALLAAAAIWALPRAQGAAAAATVTATSCGADFKPARAGTQTIAVTNKSKKAGEINLLNSAGAVVGEIETLAPNTSADLVATLADGTYSMRCLMAGEKPRDSAPVAVTGAVDGPLPLPVARVTEEDLKPVIAAYTEYVQGKLAMLAPQLDAIRAALRRGDAEAAKAAWLPALVTWDEVGAAYGSFGDYGDAVDMLPVGLPGGARDEGFTGLHRLEHGLWHGEEPAALVRVLDAISASVADLRANLGSVMTEPLDFTKRPHEVLEDALRFPLMGYTDQGGGAQYAEVEAGVSATRALLGQVRGLVAARDPGFPPKAATQLDALEAALRATQKDGRWQPLAEVAPERQRAVAGALGQVLETLADVPALLELPTNR